MPATIHRIKTTARVETPLKHHPAQTVTMQPGRLQVLWRAIDYLALALAGLAALALLGLVAIVLLTVAARVMPALSPGDTEPVIRLLLVVVVSGSLAFGARHGSQVHLDVLGLPPEDPHLRGANIFGRLVGVFAVSALAVALWFHAACESGCGAAGVTAFADPFFQQVLALGIGGYAVMLAAELASLTVRSPRE